jgi:hypothetical protein
MEEVLFEELSVSHFQDTIDEWIKVRDEIDEREEAIKPLSERRRELEGVILQMLEATGLEKFQGRLGGVEKRTVDYVNQPPDERRHEFLEYLIDKGELSDVVTFHQGRLTSWYKHKKEELGFEFTAPGLGEMKQRFELRRKK